MQRRHPAAGELPRVDVLLHAGGTMYGQVLDGHGCPSRGSPVALWYHGRSLATTFADQEGRFILPNLENGVYLLTAPHAVVVCRAWHRAAAPPTAVARVLVTAQPDVVCGQCRPGEAVNWFFKHPLLTIGTISAAIAIPVALAAKERSPASP